MTDPYRNFQTVFSYDSGPIGLYVNRDCAAELGGYFVEILLTIENGSAAGCTVNATNARALAAKLIEAAAAAEKAVKTMPLRLVPTRPEEGQGRER